MTKPTNKHLNLVLKMMLMLILLLILILTLTSKSLKKVLSCFNFLKQLF